MDCSANANTIRHGICRTRCRSDRRGIRCKGCFAQAAAACSEALSSSTAVCSLCSNGLLRRALAQNNEVLHHCVLSTCHRIFSRAAPFMATALSKVSHSSYSSNSGRSHGPGSGELVVSSKHITVSLVCPYVTITGKGSQLQVTGGRQNMRTI